MCFTMFRLCTMCCAANVISAANMQSALITCVAANILDVANMQCAAVTLQLLFCHYESHPLRRPFILHLLPTLQLLFLLQLYSNQQSFPLSAANHPFGAHTYCVASIHFAADIQSARSNPSEANIQLSGNTPCTPTIPPAAFRQQPLIAPSAANVHLAVT